MRLFLGVSCVLHAGEWQWADGVIEYSCVIPHDVETLIEFMGGPKTFESRLDMMVGLTDGEGDWRLT